MLFMRGREAMGQRLLALIAVAWVAGPYAHAQPAPATSTVYGGARGQSVTCRRIDAQVQCTPVVEPPEMAIIGPEYLNRLEKITKYSEFQFLANNSQCVEKSECRIVMKGLPPFVLRCDGIYGGPCTLALVMALAQFSSHPDYVGFSHCGDALPSSTTHCLSVDDVPSAPWYALEIITTDAALNAQFLVVKVSVGMPSIDPAPAPRP
jgi:hypothetical protein